LAVARCRGIGCRDPAALRSQPVADRPDRHAERRECRAPGTARRPRRADRSAHVGRGEVLGAGERQQFGTTDPARVVVGHREQARTSVGSTTKATIAGGTSTDPVAFSATIGGRVPSSAAARTVPLSEIDPESSESLVSRYTSAD